MLFLKNKVGTPKSNSEILKACNLGEVTTSRTHNKAQFQKSNFSPHPNLHLNIFIRPDKA